MTGLQEVAQSFPKPVQPNEDARVTVIRAKTAELFDLCAALQAADAVLGQTIHDAVAETLE